MIEKGRLCVKTAGRDAGLKCVIVEIIDNSYVIIDGETRRKKCNIAHLELLDSVLPIKDGSRDEVKSVFASDLKIELKDKKPKEKTERPRKQRKEKAAPQEKGKKKEKKVTAKKPEKAEKPEATKEKA